MFNRSSAVIVGLSGGLGNQMFQYAAGRALAHHVGCSLDLDLAWFQGRSDRQYALAPFNIAADHRRAWSGLPDGLQSLISRASRRWAPWHMGVPVFREPHFHYTEAFAALTGPAYLEGYWQSERYFQMLRPLLLQEFSLREPMPPACQDLLDEIHACDAICVHVRRGDYISNPVAARVHGTCSVNYYRNGVAELCEGLPMPRCFIFSDDAAWVRASLAFDCPTTVVDVNGTEDAHLDLILMAACQHFLIANSSLSWWGAWLGVDAEKKVIAPARWFAAADRDDRDLVPAAWTRR